jgi:hypothetical protein
LNKNSECAIQVTIWLFVTSYFDICYSVGVLGYLGQSGTDIGPNDVKALTAEKRRRVKKWHSRLRKST